MSNEEFKKKFKGHIKTASFKNEYGEEFEVHSTPHDIFFAGDETDWYVIPLFGRQFNVWSIDEIGKLGKALVKVSK